MFPKIVVPQNGWFRMENLIEMDDLGVPLFSETSISSLWCGAVLINLWHLTCLKPCHRLVGLDFARTEFHRRACSYLASKEYF